MEEDTCGVLGSDIDSGLDGTTFALLIASGLNGHMPVVQIL